MAQTNPHKYDTPEYRQWQVNQAIMAAKRANENPLANVAEVQDIRFGKAGEILEELSSLSGQQRLLGGPLNQVKYAAEGGEIDQPEGEMSLLYPDPTADVEEEAEDTTIGYLDGLRDILGEEDYMQLESAMYDYPVVETVARMAVYSKENDGEGEVDGIGGPKEDLVPARLSPGEFVFSKEAVDVIGVGVLEQMHEQAKQEAAMSAV